MGSTSNRRLRARVAAALVAALAAVLVAGACLVAPAYADDAASSNGSSRTEGTDYSKYPVFAGANNGQTDENGFRILTNEACGCQLVVGESYRVTSNVTLEPSSSDYTAGLVANNNLIYVDAGCTLTVRGSNGNGRNPGLPGIALTSGKNLMLTGEGTVYAYGGKAGDGHDGYDGESAHSHNTGEWDTMYSGRGGRGGDGGGGAGAGIGTAGGKGGEGGSGGDEVWVICDRREPDKNGLNGEKGGNGGTIDEPGKLCIAGNVTVNAKGGDRSSYDAHGGQAASWFCVNSSAITKHLSGASGGGGGGSGGSSANGYGKGGEGGGGGGGGGGAGAMWRTRGTSDDPPSAEGGGNGLASSCDAYSGCCGKGEMRTIGEDNCHGGKGGEGGRASSPGTDSSKFNVLAYGNAVKNAVLPAASRSSLNRGISAFEVMYPELFPKRSLFPTKATVNTLSSYTGFSDVPDNGGWYVKNQLLNADGKSTLAMSYATIAGVTTVKEVEEALSSNVPTASDATFMGWAITLTDGSTALVYDAQTKKLNTAVLVNAKKVVMSSGTEGVWMSAAATPLIAVWQKDASQTVTIVYHTNGGTFVDSAGKTVEGDQYADAGQPTTGSAKLWDNDTIGTYRLNPPAGMASTTKLLGWTKKVDDQGYAAGTVYKPGALVSDVYSSGPKEVHLYAVWKEESNAAASSSAGTAQNGSSNASSNAVPSASPTASSTPSPTPSPSSSSSAASSASPS